MSAGAPSAWTCPDAHRDEVVGVAGGEPEVVQDHHHGRAAAPVEVHQEVEDLDLVGDVEEGGRLVEEQQVGALGQGHGQPHPLPLAAGQLVDVAAGEVEGVGDGERLGHRALVLGRPAPERPLVRVAAPGDEVDDGHPLRDDRRLGEQPERLRPPRGC